MFLMTNSGGRLKPEAIDPDLIQIKDIALSLSKINRYNGHTDRVYTLANHACVLHDYVRDNISTKRDDLMWALMSQAPKVYLGDIPRPWKKMTEVAAVWYPNKRAIMDVICDKWEFDKVQPDYLEELRKRIILDEMKYYFAGKEHTRESWDLPEDWEPLGVMIPHRNGVMDFNAFMNKFKELQDPVRRFLEGSNAQPAN